MSKANMPWRTACLWGSRFVVGAAFIFSGFTKGVDPWGTIYKIEQYLELWGMTQPRSLVLAAAFLLCAVEFLLGIALFCGIYRRVAPRLAAVFMIFFLVVTGYSAIFSPISDCGCFGDALKMSNWATFFKNVVLMIPIVWLLKANKSQGGFFSSSVQWIVLVATLFYIGTLETVGYMIQPLVDFRPFPVGTDLLSETDLSDMRLVYSKDGKTKEFGLEELPDADSGWEYVGRKNVKDESQRLELEDADGDNALEELLEENDSLILLVIPESARADVASTMYINRIHDFAQKEGYGMAGVIGTSTPDDINIWKDLSMARYPVFAGDDSQLKSLSRGEMSLVLIKYNVIESKISMSVISNAKIQEVYNGEITVRQLLEFDRGHILTLLNVSYISILVLLSVISLPMGRRKRSAKDNDSGVEEEKNEIGD